MRESLIEASAEGRAEDVLATIEVIGIGLVATYEEQFARQRQIDTSFERGIAAVECRKGCNFCCRLKVTATVLEVVRIAAAINLRGQTDHLPGPALAEREPVRASVRSECRDG